MNENLLRAKIVEKGFNIGTFCRAAGFVRSTFERKLFGVSQFDLADINRIVETLDLTDEEIMGIFFARLGAKSSNTGR